MKFVTPTILIGTVVLLSACSPSGDTNLQDSIDTTSHTALFDTDNGIIPFPNNLLFAGSEDGTLNIPIDPADTGYSNPKVALNEADGFSTVAPITAPFSTAIDAASITPATVRMFQVTLNPDPAAPVIIAVNSELQMGEDFLAAVSSVDSNTLALIPRKPLAPGTSYFVILTNGLKATDGKGFNVDVTYALAKRTDPVIDAEGNNLVPALASSATANEDAQTLEKLRQLVNANETAIVTHDSGLSRDQLIMTWTFTTQSIGAVLAQARTLIRGGSAPATQLQDTTVDSPMGAADLYAGTLTVPYYLTAASTDNPTAPLTNFWHGAGASRLSQYNAMPVKTADATIPLLLSVPKAAVKPVPIVIFQHGITANRASMLAIADSLAQAGLAVAAIDLPLHGILGNETDGTEALVMTGMERHFSLDLVDNATGAAGPDGNLDDSGQHFINLTNLVVNRDNVRQAIADLFALTYAMTTLDYDGGGADIDTSRIYFLGHSLGGIVGAPFLAFETDIKASVLAMAGGGIAKILDGSASFGPVIAGGLAANGVNKGSADYESFLGAAQTLLDTADPINYTGLIGGFRGVLLLEVVGGNSSPSDLVVPNKVPDDNDDGTTVIAPLAGTDPFASLLGLTKYNSSQAGSNLQAWVRFNAGHHASPFRPTDANGNDDALSAQVTTEMQTEIAGFLGSNGASLGITDGTLLAAP